MRTITRDRAANVIIILSLLGVVIFAGVFSLGFLTKTDVSTTTKMLRELRATFLAESIVAQIEGLVNNTPWVLRFWLVEAEKSGTFNPGTGLVPEYTFNKSCPYLDLSGDSLPANEYDFVGQIKDLPASPFDASPNDVHSYRVYLEVTLKGETYSFAWTKHWMVGLLVGLNRDTTLLEKGVGDGASSSGAVDSLMDDIRTKIIKAPPTDGSNNGQFQRLKTLRKDRKSFKGKALMQTPEPPSSPPKPPEDNQQVKGK